MADFEPNQETLCSYVGIIRQRFLWLVAFRILAVAVATAIISGQQKEYSMLSRRPLPP
jgi:hypothetical protein